MAVGRAPGVACLCLGPSAFIYPDSWPASFPFLSLLLSPGTRQPDAYRLPRTKARCWWVCVAPGLGRGDPGGHLLCGLLPVLADAPADPALPSAQGEGSGFGM